MAGPEMAMPLMKGMSSMMGGKGGGGKGGGSGGVSPQQAALARYTMGQQILKTQSDMANSGTGQSTGATQETGGAAFGQAYQLANMSDANQTAAYNTAQTQQSALQQIAQNAGSGGFGQGFQSGTSV